MGFLSKIAGGGVKIVTGNPIGGFSDQFDGLSDSPLGDLIPGIGDAKAQERANKHNLLLDKMNREWQERMANSAYQRAMEDMRKAGLNPILAYQQGGAAVPSTSAPTVGAASKTRLADSALSAYTGISAAHSQQQQANTAQAQAQSTIALQSSQAAQTVAQTAKTEAETEKVKETIKSERVRRKLDEGSLKVQAVKSSAAEVVNKGMDTVEKIGNSLLKNSAKPHVNPKTLEYENPWNIFGNKNSHDAPLIKNKGN